MLRRTRTTSRTSVAAARRSRPAPVPKVDYTEEIQERLQTIANLERQMEDLQRQRAVAEEEIKEFFKRSGEDVVSDGIYEVKMHTPAGRSSTVIDPKKFQKFAGDEAFWKCCKIGVTEAKSFLSEKELAKVSTITPGTAGKPEVVITKIKKKGK